MNKTSYKHKIFRYNNTHDNFTSSIAILGNKYNIVFLCDVIIDNTLEETKVSYDNYELFYLL